MIIDMKRIIAIISILAALVGCNKQLGEGYEPQFESTVLNFDAEGGQNSFKANKPVGINECIYSNSEGERITIHESDDPANGNICFKSDWFCIFSSSDATEIMVELDKNLSGADRKVTIAVSTGNWFGSLTVNQSK